MVLLTGKTEPTYGMEKCAIVGAPGTWQWASALLPVCFCCCAYADVSCVLCVLKRQA